MNFMLASLLYSYLSLSVLNDRYFFNDTVVIQHKKTQTSYTSSSNSFLNELPPAFDAKFILNAKCNSLNEPIIGEESEDDKDKLFLHFSHTFFKRYQLEIGELGKNKLRFRFVKTLPLYILNHSWKSFLF